MAFKIYGTTSTSTPSLSSSEGLASFASSKGYQQEVDKITGQDNKLGFLQRIGKGLGAFNPAEALLTGMKKGVGAGIKEYGKDIATGIGSAITGTDYEVERRGFKDVAKKLGIKNKIAQSGIGFLGDVLLDPSTYFGGALAKGITAGVKIGTRAGLKGVSKISPELGQGLEMTGKALQDSFGRAFVAGYKSSEGAKTDVLSFMSTKARKIAQAASDQLTDLGVDGLTQEQRLEVGLKAALGKQAEFLLGEKVGGRDAATAMTKRAQESGNFSEIEKIDKELSSKLDIKFKSPEEQKYFKLQQERSQKFAKDAGLEDPYAVYMPFLQKNVTDKFIIEMNKSGIQVGSEGWRKQFKNILKVENIELDPRKAFFTRESQIISDTESRKFLTDFVEKYGKPLDSFASESEAKAAGLKILREKGGFGKPVGYVGEWDAKLFNDLIRPEFQTINMLAKATGFDAMTSLFKRSVTGLFLPFHVRNFVSGAVQNFETIGVEALNPKTIANAQGLALNIAKGTPWSGKIELAGKTFNKKELFKAFDERFAGDTFYHTDFGDAADAGKMLASQEKAFSKESLKKTLGFQKGNIVPLVGEDSTAFKLARTTGQFIEHQQKATAYLGALNKGKTIDEALKLAERAGFDYRSLTAFESQIMRRIIPFYSFTRKNIELQLKTMGESPERINQIIKFVENTGDKATPEERKNLPDYISDSFAIKLKDSPEGLKQYISNFGTPIEAFANLFSKNKIFNTISMMNPALKLPIELGIGKDSFRKRDLKDVYDAREYKNAPEILKSILNINEVDKPILKKQQDGTLKEVGKRTSYVADPERLLIARSLFTSRGVSYLDKLFGGDLKGLSKMLSLTTGTKPQQIDIEAQAAFKDKETRQLLEDMLIRLGEVREFRKIYEPKE